MKSIDAEVERVVSAQNCSGCGACCLIDPGLQMELDGGFLRPHRSAPGGGDERADARTFRQVCPGVRVRARRPAKARRHPTMGSYFGVWEAWATDPEIRHRGSSGGTLTALVDWLTHTGEQARFVGAAASVNAPDRTVTVTIGSRPEALESAGSRYAPVANASDPRVRDGVTAMVGKPCEVAAVRRLEEVRPAGGEAPLLLSFFCAGTPSQDATDRLVGTLGVEDRDDLRSLWYRGRGWPGSFTAETKGGQRLEMSYDDSWGRHLGPTVQWRCKICPDGVGESSDITAADFWAADERGFPSFVDADGRSALIARTARGHDVIERAMQAGVLVGRPVAMEALAAIQPLQHKRRQFLLGRLMGARLAGRSVPRFTRFGLVRLAATRPRELLRVARGTYQRLRSARR